MDNSSCELQGAGGDCDADSSDPDPLILLPVLVSFVWVLFVSFYVPSLLGFLVKNVVNSLLKDSGIHIGAIYANVLTGRVLFKDLQYYCRDYSVRVTDGYAVLRWWRRERDEEARSKCCSSSRVSPREKALISVQLNGFEYHWYNRSEDYDNYGEPDKSTDGDGDSSNAEESGRLWRLWMEMQPTLQFNIKKGRIVFGNHHVENSLIVYFEKAEAHYSTAQASTPYDELMHLVQFHGDSVSMVLEPSKGYEGEVKESPPIATDGTTDVYPVIRTDSVHCTYSLDSPGLVPLGQTRGPKFAFDVQLGDNTVINYGCYANRQRSILQKFFFPNDYMERPPTRLPQPGEKSIYTFFDISIQLTSPGTFNLLFKDKEHIHRLALDIGSESSLVINQPWTTGEDGYVSVVQGRLTDVRVNTSLDYQPFGKADTVEFKVDLHFPRVWNATQTWDMTFGASKVEVNIFFSYIDFVNALLDDWLGDDPSDLYSFVPVDWNIDADLTRYEIYLFANQYNWIDVAKDDVENTRYGFCGTNGHIKIEFPFTEFIPPSQRVFFGAHGENIVVRRYIPPSCSSLESVFALSSANKHRWRVMEYPEPSEVQRRPQAEDRSTASSSPSVKSKTGVSKASSLTLDSEKEKEREGFLHPRPKFTIGSDQDNASMRPLASIDTDAQVLPKIEELPDNEFFPMGYRNQTQYEKGWIELACGPVLDIAITYHSHAHDADPGQHTALKPNQMEIVVDAPTVLFRVYGFFFKDLLTLKENFIGENQNFKVFNSALSRRPPAPPQPQEEDPKPKLTDETPVYPADYIKEPDDRFIEVHVEFKLHNLTGEFPTHLPEGYPKDFPLPSLHTTLLAVIGDYRTIETKVRIGTEPFTVHLPSMTLPSGNRGGGGGGGGEGDFEMGNIACTGLNLNCHGFTEFMCQERVEYAWLMQLQIGRITGAIWTDHLLQAVDWLHTAFIHMVSHGDEFVPAPGALVIEPKVERFSEDIKYFMFDITLAEGDLHLLEGNTVTRLQCPGLDVGFCNLFSKAEVLALSLQLQGLTVSSYVPTADDPSCMLECGCVDIGNILGDLSVRDVNECVPRRQRYFLERADAQSKRLWFLWSEGGGRGEEFRCGCWGGCAFYDSCVQRSQPQEKDTSVVYAPPFLLSESLKSETGPSAHRVLGLHNLRRTLPTLCVKNLDCVRLLHQGLLEHYDLRYSQEPQVRQSSATASGREEGGALESQVSADRSSVTSEGSFHSARSSLTSLAEDEFASIPSVNEAGLSDLRPPFPPDARRTRHRKTRSVVSHDIKSTTSTHGGKEGTDPSATPPIYHSHDTADALKDLVPSQLYKPVALYIPLKTERADKHSDTKRRSDGHRHHRRQLSHESPLISYRAENMDTQSLRTPQPSISGAASPAVLSSQQSLRHTSDVRHGLRVQIPILMPLSAGSLPAMVRRGGRTPVKRRRAGHWHDGMSGDEQLDEANLAKFSFSLYVNGKATAMLSPPLLNFVNSVVNTVGGFFERRTAEAILDAVANESSGSVLSTITKILDQPSTMTQAPDPPLLHIALEMSPSAFVGFQFVQAPLDLPAVLRRPPPLHASLKEIVRHGSVLSAYLSGLSVTALIQTDVEVQLPEGRPGGRGGGEGCAPSGDEVDMSSEPRPASSLSGPSVTGSGGKTKRRSRILLNTVKVSVEAKCPVLQASLCALVMPSVGTKEGDGGREGDSCPPGVTLPGVQSSQSQLDFDFVFRPSDPVWAEKPKAAGISAVACTVCNLLELGVRDASVTCVAKIIRSEISEASILTWKNIQAFRLTDPTSSPRSDDYEMKNDKMVVRVSLPYLWSQLATPATGIPSSSTGGLDVLILSEVVDMWKPGVEQVVSAAELAIKRKSERDKRALLAILSSTVGSPLVRKMGNPLLCEASISLRQSAVYNCMTQLWRTIPGLSGQMVPGRTGDNTSHDEGVIATTLGLVSRLYSQQEEVMVGVQTRRDTTVLDSSSSVGYISISPSPSELALPNLAYVPPDVPQEVDCDKIFGELPFGRLVVVRESVLPFLQATGIPVEPQLRTKCHNSNEIFADFSVELREACVYAIECVAPPTVPESSSLYPPVVFAAERFVIDGCLKYAFEASLGKTPNLSLFATKTTTNAPKESDINMASTVASKMNISAKCCVSLNSIRSTITVPLLKLSRHMAETSKLHTSWKHKLHKDGVKSKPTLDDSAGVGKPTVTVVDASLPPGGLAMGGASTRMASQTDRQTNEQARFQGVGTAGEETNVWEFSAALVLYLSALEQQSVGGPEKASSGAATPASSRGVGSSRPQVINYAHTPKFPRAGFFMSPLEKESPEAHQRFLSLPTSAADLLSDSSSTRPPRAGKTGRTSPVGEKQLLSSTSNVSLTSGEVAIRVEDVDSPPQEVFAMSADELDAPDFHGGDTTDSPHVASSEDNDIHGSSSPSVKKVSNAASHITAHDDTSVAYAPFGHISDTYPLTKSLGLSEGELLFTVFGLLKINSVHLGFQVETTEASLDITGISAAVDARKASPTAKADVSVQGVAAGAREEAPPMSELLPTYLSISGTLKKSMVRVRDRGLADNELVTLRVYPTYCSLGICNSSLCPLPTYRCLLKATGINVDVKQPPVRIHKRFQHLMPAFHKIYSDVFAPSSPVPVVPDLFPPEAPPTASTPLAGKSDLKLPGKLPQGFVHFSLDRAVVLMTPLPSLTVEYMVAPVVAQVETLRHITFGLSVGHEHSLKFTPREHKDELSLRYVALPTVTLTGDVRTSRHARLPRVSLELSVKQLNIDLTTDVLNQLLILQNSFIKEVNELVQLFTKFGESIPHHRRERLERFASIRRQETPAQQSEVELLSFLESCKILLSGICITVSTPLSTSLRFSTGKIDMHVTNTGMHMAAGPTSPVKSQLLLSGRVDIDISLAIGYLKDSGADEEDDFCELAYFRTRISIRNTQKNVSQQMSGAGMEARSSSPMLMDTFLISIVSPHLYIQSNAVEQAILFWLNCKSVYSYWQNERKQLNAEVQAATEAFIQKIHRPTQLQSTTIDFATPRLVQITVSDVGACMPLTPLPTTPHSTLKAFPATVLTIKEMHLLLNLSHKAASTGNFSGFCVRFAEQFSTRHKTWTMDAKRHKFSNCGTVKQGTFRLCVASHKHRSETDPTVVLGEKLIWAFQWDMSGIDVNANTKIGRHISTLVKTVTTIGSDLEGRQHLKRARSGTIPTSKPLQPPRVRRSVSAPRPLHIHRRATSLSYPRSPFAPTASVGEGGQETVEDSYTAALEQDLARQTSKVQRMRYSGATGESLKSEEDALRQVEMTLAKKVGRMLRRGKGISLYRLNQIFSPKALTTGKIRDAGGFRRKLSLASRTAGTARRQLFSFSGEPPIAEEPSSPPSSSEDQTERYKLRRRAKTVSTMQPTHSRAKSDITDIMQYMRMEEGRSASATPPVDDTTSPVPGSGTGMGPDEEKEGRESSASPFNAEGKTEGGKEKEEVEEYVLPSIDVEVNVTVNVDSGRIVLRSEDSVDRRGSAPVLKPYSPSLRKLQTSMDLGQPSPSMRYTSKLSPHGPSVVDTIVMVPALKVKVHYQSIVGGAYSAPTPPPSPVKLTRSIPPRPVMKEATPPTPLASTPEQPHKAVSWAPEPPEVFEKSRTPSPRQKSQTDESGKEKDEEPSEKRGILSISAIVSSVPEDLELTPSLLEFVEQVARPTIAAAIITSSSDTESDAESDSETTPSVIPSQPAGEPAAISYPVDVTITLQIHPSTVHLSCKPHSRVQCMIQTPDVHVVVSFSLFSRQLLGSSLSSDPLPPSTTLPPTPASKTVTFNNLYVTGCFTTFALQLFSPQMSMLRPAHDVRAPRLENREALSLTLGQALIHLSRISVLVPLNRPKERGKVKSVDDYSMHSKLQVSVITDIASLVMGYDMRRLNDITAFRRYWYRTSLVEALFIGSKKPKEEATPTQAEGSEMIGTPPSTSGEESSAEPSAIADIDNTISAAIVVAANVADFRLSANMAQVMGHANLLLNHLKCTAHADVSHNELVLFNLDGWMEKGEVDARGGMIAGSVLVEDVQALVTTDTQQGSIPVHQGSVSVSLIEGRVDYMSACIALTRATQVKARFSDSWEGLRLDGVVDPDDPEGVRSEEGSIQILADFSWEKLQLSLHQATTKSMFNIVQKMYEFIMQQKRRSERTISMMLPPGSAASRALAAYREEQKRAEEKKEGAKDDTRHHWLWAVRVGSLQLMQALGIPTPSQGPPEVSLGGKITVSGQNVCLVCFHGPTFRETEWAVFNIDLLNASFSTQAIPGLGTPALPEALEDQVEGYNQLKMRRTCQQICRVQLGTKETRSTQLAAIYRVSTGRSRVPLITGTNVHDWLDYACIDYTLHSEKYAHTPSSSQSNLIKFSRKLNVQSILLVPALCVELTNDHFWPALRGSRRVSWHGTEEEGPSVGDSVPVVECSLVSSFSAGISVTTTVDHYLFLHDLVKGYIDYLERHKTPLSKTSPSAEPAPTQQPPEDEDKVPHRRFMCVHWELNPHLLLLSAISGQFNPHISWLLETLGFKDARTTIPKWIQRGAMDPLDMVIANLVELLVTVSAKKKLQLRVLSPLPPDASETAK